MSAATGPELRDIHLPAAPGWWPPAPGWWVLAGLVAIATIWICIRLRRRTRRRRIRSAILRELDLAVTTTRHDPPQLAASLSQFLRRLALRSAPQAAAFGGERWMSYLDAQVGSDEFSRGIGRVLLDAPFQRTHAFDSDALIALVRRYTRAVLDGTRADA